MNHCRRLRIGMVGLGMIFAETYLPAFRRLQTRPLFHPDFGLVEIDVVAVVSRTGQNTARAAELGSQGPPQGFIGEKAVAQMLAEASPDVVCVATPDQRHFEVVRQCLGVGKHVLIEKPSVLRLSELDQLDKLAFDRDVVAKVTYHKLFDPDHKKLRTHVVDGVLRHVNNGFCSLLEPKSISQTQFAEWIAGRNPASYVAVHYLKLIDFTFGPDWKLHRVFAAGQRGQVAAANSTTWDAVQLRVVYEYSDGREAAFDIHTDWVTPNNFPGAVEQEVQFRFDNGVWKASQRNRGVEMVVEPLHSAALPMTPNHHYSATFVEPWGERSQRGYGIEAIERFLEEVAMVEFGGEASQRDARLQQIRERTYNDLSADRKVIAVVQSCEAILEEHTAGRPGAVAEIRDDGLILRLPDGTQRNLYSGSIN